MIISVFLVVYFSCIVKHRFFTFGLFILYIVVTTSVMIWQGIGIAPDRYAFVLIFASLFIKRTRSFFLDFLPFIFLLISYDFLRSFAANLMPHVNYALPIDADKLIFGMLPTVTLQKLFFHPPALLWYDYASTILYFLHFALPLAFAFLLWIGNRRHFREFTTGILIVSYTAWVTFLLFPAAPPWLAQQKGYISGVTKIMDLTLQSFPTRLDLPTVYKSFNPNPVAAIPSLHAGYVFLVLLFALKYFKKKGLFFLPYVLAVWISIVYLGEHYFFDVIIGAVYAAFSYVLAKKVLHAINWQPVFKKLKSRLLPAR